MLVGVGREGTIREVLVATPLGRRDTMPLKLPNPKRTKCRRFCACGEIVSQDRAVLKWLSDQEGKVLRGRFGTSPNVWYLQVSFGPSGKHFHVDAFAKEAFGKSPPKEAPSAKEIRESLTALKGQRINVRVSGVYQVQETELPDFIRSTMVEGRAGDVSLKTAGGRFGVEGAPIDELRWSMGTAGQARIELAARTTMTIGDSYLQDCCSLLDAVFAVLFPRD